MATEDSIDFEKGIQCENANEEAKGLFFYPSCNTNPLCQANKGAWVPAITVCNQNL